MQPRNSSVPRPLGRLAGSLASAALVIGAIGVAVAPQAAASDATVNLIGVQANGQVGVPQSLAITAAIQGAPCGSVLAPAATIQSSVTGSTQTIGTATFASCVGNAYQYLFQWVPGSAIISYISATVADGTSNAIRSAIAPVPTTTRITAASTVMLGQPTTVTASVTANNGSLTSPQGAIQFSVVGGGPIGGPIALNNAVPSTVQIQWTPAVLGTVALLATYIPGPVNGVINTTCGTTCASAPDSVVVTTTGVKMYLANPPAFNAGTPATITAVVSVVPPTGGVTFTVNGAAIAANVPVQSNGQAQATWTPPAPGTYNVGAFWTGNGGMTGSAQETISVGSAAPQPDAISVAPQGQGAWSPASVYTLGNGSRVVFTTSTASGAPVSLTAPGPCTISGTTLTITAGNGQCRLVANSPGGNGYGAATATYTINLVPGTQSPRATVRASGQISRGTTITLATRANNVTNAGQRMSWSIQSGRNFCQLRYPSNGSVRLRAVRNGSCNVRATAPAVTGQWTRMVLNRTYRVR